MIFYNHDREVITDLISYIPKSCFIMTQLGLPLPKNASEIRDAIKIELDKRNYEILDANSKVTGKDFLNKIWRIILSVPIGVAILTEEMKASTVSNIFYEIGVLNALGKETIVIKSADFIIPSDFIRTEYIESDKDFSMRFNKFLDTVFELADHYEIMAESLISNPNLAIDYYRRAYLITGDKEYFERVKEIRDNNKFDTQSLNFIQGFLSTEKRMSKKKKK